MERAAHAARVFGDANDAVDQAVADHFGVNRTDLAILAAAHLDGPLSAGRLAGTVTLSPAATTEAVQRLVAKGLLTRETDPADRRRARIAIVAAVGSALDRFYEPVRDGGFALLRGYTLAELELIRDFLDRGRALQLAAAERIRTGG
jgi:DNA-binding MarR family transcriptional regulator